MNTQTIPTYLPLFSGFYNTIWSTDNEAEYLSEKWGYPRDYVIEALIQCFDYEEYQTDIVQFICDHVSDILKEEGWITSMQFENISSPREYNFKNDSGNVQVELSPTNSDNILTSVRAHWDQFSKHISNHYISGPGFISLHSNDAHDWVNDTMDFTRFDDEHKLGAVLEFLLYYVAGVSEETIYNCMVDNTSLSHYYDDKKVKSITLIELGEPHGFECTGYHCTHCSRELNGVNPFDSATIEKAFQFFERFGKRTDVVCYRCAGEIYGKPVN